MQKHTHSHTPTHTCNDRVVHCFVWFLFPWYFVDFLRSRVLLSRCDRKSDECGQTNKKNGAQQQSEHEFCDKPTKRTQKLSVNAFVQVSQTKLLTTATAKYICRMHTFSSLSSSFNLNNSLKNRSSMSRLVDTLVKPS